MEEIDMYKASHTFTCKLARKWLEFESILLQSRTIYWQL